MQNHRDTKCSKCGERPAAHVIDSSLTKERYTVHHPFRMPN